MKKKNIRISDVCLIHEEFRDIALLQLPEACKDKYEHKDEVSSHSNDEFTMIVLKYSVFSLI